MQFNPVFPQFCCQSPKVFMSQCRSPWSNKTGYDKTLFLPEVILSTGKDCKSLSQCTMWYTYTIHTKIGTRSKWIIMITLLIVMEIITVMNHNNDKVNTGNTAIKNKELSPAALQSIQDAAQRKISTVHDALHCSQECICNSFQSLGSIPAASSSSSHKADPAWLYWRCSRSQRTWSSQLH